MTTTSNLQPSHPGRIIIRPIQANMTSDDDLIGKMDPYCTFAIGNKKGKTEVCKDGGKHPFWNRVISLKLKDEPFCELKIKNKKIGPLSTTIGTSKIELVDIGSHPKVTKWFDVYKGTAPTGKILLDITFEPEAVTPGTTNIQRLA